MDWKIEDEGTRVEFMVKQFWGLVRVRGKMQIQEFVLNMDVRGIENGSVYTTIGTSSVDTGKARRDKHLKSVHFFDANRYPAIIFRSTGVEPLDENRFRLRGDLTIRDITRQIALEVTKGFEAGGESAEFWGTTTLVRQDFGINFNKVPIGREVEIKVRLKVKQLATLTHPVTTA